MASKVLIIEGDDQGHFFLMVDGQTLYVGDDPTHADSVLTDLRIKRIHCELDVGDELDGVSEGGVAQDLLAGGVVHLGHAHLHLKEMAAPDEAQPELTPLAEASASPGPSTPDVAPQAPVQRKHLRIVDGPDVGLTFIVPETGTICIGKSHKHAEIVLHDLYVSRVHCQLRTEGDIIEVMHLEGPNGTLINGVRITEPKMIKPGDVLRIGNSHLRLETVSHEDIAAIPEFETEEIVEEPAAKPATADALLRLENQVLGHHQLGAFLGRGYGGAIFRAEDINTKETVALKVLAPEFPANPAELQHFVQVMKVANHLRHPNLVALHGAGRSGAHCWMAREYVEGKSLTALIHQWKEEGQLKWKRAGRLAVHLARALAFLQVHKVCHRDINPNTVLMRESDRVFLLTDVSMKDALAGSKLEESASKSIHLTDLPYLAPEQLDPGAAGNPCSDLYSLGAAVYTLLTGLPPFNGNSATEIHDQIRNAKPVRPGKLQPHVPAPFEAVVMKLLAKLPKDRYQTAAELLTEGEAIAKEHDIKL